MQRLLTLLTLFAPVTLACGSTVAGPDSVQAPDDSGRQVTGRVATLVEALTQQGAAVMVMERMSPASHCLSVGARRLVVNGENVYAFEYESAESAGRDASGISSDGRTIASGGNVCMPGWTGPPRFYRQDRLIALYVGTDTDLIRILDRTLGNPFAHR
jgi:hypothetical protein